MNLIELPAVTVTGELDAQGRLSSVAAVVRSAIIIRVTSGTETVFDETLQAGSYSKNIPVPRRVAWEVESPGYSTSVVML